MRRTTARLTIVALLGMPAAIPATQETPPQFPVESTRVTVDVVVHDRHGRPVTDLTAADFEVLEDGVPQRVDQFVPAVLPSPEASGVVAQTARPAEGRGAEATPAAAGAPSGHAAIALVFDRLSTPGRVAAQEAARDLVEHGRTTGDAIGVFSVEGPLVVLQDLTVDPALLAAALDALGSREAHSGDSAAKRMQAAANDRSARSEQVTKLLLSREPGDPTEQAAMKAEIIRLQMTERIMDGFERLESDAPGFSLASALTAIVEALHPFAGRKAIVLFSEGLVRTEATEARLQSVVHSASRGNVSVYIVDASGLQTRSYESATGNLIRSEALRRRAAEEKGALDPTGPGGVSLRDLERNEALVRSNPQAGLEWLSGSTGGFLIRDTNDLSGALRRIDTDLRFYYLLGYTPADPTWDGRFRTIAVKARRPGVEVRSRGGYFAVHSQGPVLAHVAPALTVLESGGHPRAFEVIASARSSPDAVDLTRVSVQATVTGEELAHLADRERLHGVDVTLLARLRQGSNGQPVSTMSQRCLVDPSKQKGSDADCRLNRDVWLAPGRYALEVVAYEAKSRRASVAVSDVEIPAGVPGPAAATVPTTDVKPTLPGAAPQLPVVSSSRRPVDPALVPILERAGRYVLEYEEAFRNIVAEEMYTQWTGDPGVHDSIRGLQRRVTRADLVFVRLGEASWASFRDVFEVDGQKIRDRDGRLEKLFRDAPGSAVGRASAILAESARYNIGTALRRINLPTLALLLLQPRNQPRLEFELGGHRRIAGVKGVEVKFEEVERPTLFRGEGSSNLPVRGRFWIVPGRGTVLRSEVRYRFEPDRAIATVATEYRPEPRLAMWVPVEMKERYEDLPEAFLPLFRQLTEATARYSNFRKFTVTIEDVTATVPPETPEPRPDP